MKSLSLFFLSASTLFFLFPGSFQTQAQEAKAPTNHIPADYTGKSVTGKPQIIPGIIQVESYDITTGKAMGMTMGYGSPKKTDLRPDADSAGLARYGVGHVTVSGEAEAADQIYAGWTESGEWLAYTVEVKESGIYIVGGKFAAGQNGSLISLSFGPTLTTGPMEIPTTAGYQPGVEVYHVWEKLEKMKEITLTSGLYVMKLKVDKAAGLNMDYLTFTRKP